MNNNRRIFLKYLNGLCIAVLLITSFSSLFSFTQGRRPFKFHYDLCGFQYSDSLTYFELAVDLHRDLLKYVPKEDRLHGEYIVNAEFLQADSVITAKQWKSIDTIDSLSKVSPDQKLFCQNYFVLPTGKYRFEIKIEDANSGKYIAYASEVEAKRLSAERLAISDIQLSTSIVKGDAGDSFVKNGYRITPHPSKLYGIELPLLYSYLEIYNLRPASDDQGGQYEVTYRILNDHDEVVKTVAPKNRKKPGVSSVDVNRISVVTLHSGSYKYVIQVEDLETREKARTERQFFIYREGDFTGGTVMENDPFSQMTEKELDQEFDYLRYTNTKQQKNVYKDANLEGKQKFLREFWAEANAAYGYADDGREFRDVYLGRVEYANEALKGTFRDGWKTDRGRVVILYGRPDEIERSPHGFGKNDHEVWHYWNLDGIQCEFIFIDKRGQGEMELVHSTARGEIMDPDWPRLLGP